MAEEEEKKKGKVPNKEEKKEKNEDDSEEGGSLWFYLLIVGIVIVGAGIYAYQTDAFSGFGKSKTITSNVISDENPLKIGVMVPLSGDASSYGLSVQKGIELAKKDSRSRVKLIFEDSKCEGKNAVTVVNKLISVDKVHAIIGELCSGATLAAAPIAEEAGIVMISPASTSPAITKAGDYIFRTVPSDTLQGAFGAQLVYERDYKKLAILYSNEDYGKGFSEVLEDSYEGEIVANEAFERGSTDLRAQITKIKNSNPDAIYIISNSPDSSVAALKQIKQLGVKAQIFASEGLKSQEIVDGAGEFANGMILTSVSPGSIEFFKRFRAVYERESPGPFSPQGYDALMTILKVVDSGAKDSKEIKERLYDLTYEGVSGKIDFDKNGDVTGNYEIYVVNAGVFAPIVRYYS